jgi:hypothetical protein
VGSNSFTPGARGVATAAPTGVAEFLDIGITQSYVTQPGNWGFSEMNVGGCNAATTAAGRQFGRAGCCQRCGAANTWRSWGLRGRCFFPWGPTIRVRVGGITNLTAVAQFAFLPSGGIQAITLPWGDDFPDPTLNFGDPNNPFNFITPADIPADFLDAAPEPATFALVGGILGMAALVRRRFARKS